jgi:hypothetical protein
MALIKPEQLRSGSYEISGSFSGSFQGDGSGLNNITASLAPNYVLTSSYIQDSSSFDIRILNNSSSIDILSGSFIGFSGSYITDSASFDTRISNNSSSIDLLSSSFDSFTQTYNTGSFTGSFIGDGSQLTGIVSSKWSGSNPITRDSDVEITGSLNVSGSIDVTNIVNAFILSGSLRTDKISFTEQGTFTGVQGDLGYSFSDGKFTFYIENDVPIELGQTLYVRVRNADSVVLTKGTIVDFTADTVGQTPRVKRAIATSGSDCSCFVGIVLQNIGLNQFGAIMLNGVARGLNLTSFNTDDQLYLSSTISGSATTAIPTPPVKAIRIGKVLNASTSPTQGVLYVRPENRTVYFDLDQFKQTYNTGSFTGSFIGDGSQLTGIVSSKWSGSNPITRDSNVEITGSFKVAGQTTLQTTGSGTLKVQGSGSSQPLFLVSGSVGELLSVIDQDDPNEPLLIVSGSAGQLFVVENSTTGSLLQIYDTGSNSVFSINGNAEITYGISSSILATQFTTIPVTSSYQTIYNIQTGSYSGAFINYTVVSASNARAGQLMSVWRNGTASYAETTTTDIGDTSQIAFDVVMTGSIARIAVSASLTVGWQVKTTLNIL